MTTDCQHPDMVETNRTIHGECSHMDLVEALYDCADCKSTIHVVWVVIKELGSDFEVHRQTVSQSPTIDVGPAPDQSTPVPAVFNLAFINADLGYTQCCGAERVPLYVVGNPSKFWYCPKCGDSEAVIEQD